MTHCVFLKLNLFKQTKNAIHLLLPCTCPVLLHLASTPWVMLLCSPSSSCTSHNPEALKSENMQHISAIRDQFFSKDNIVLTLERLLVRQDCNTHDTIAETICTVIKSNICPCMTDMGVAFFEDFPLLLLSYHNMNTAQLLALKNYVLFLKRCSKYSASTQVGGGYRIITLRSYACRIEVDPALVVFACHIILHKNLPSTIDTNNIMNVILQRVTASVFISPNKLFEASVLWDEYINAQT